AAGHRLAGATLPTNAMAAAAPTPVAAATIAGGAAEPTVLATQPAATNVRALAASTVVGDPRGAAIPKSPAYGAPKSQAATIAGVAAVAAVAGVLSVAVAAGVWMLWPKSPPPEAAAGAPPASSVSTVTFPALAQAPGTPAAGASSAASPQTPVASPPPAAPSPASPQPAAPAPGTLLITAVGLADASDPRYQGDAARLQQDLRADAKGQLVEKALGLMVERASLASHYDVLNERLLAHSASFVGAVVRESAPRTGNDGLVSITTEAVVDVRAVQKSLNEMTRKERIGLIRASGDPRIAIRIAVRDGDAPDAAPRPSAAADNLLKERIKSFGFRTWSDEGTKGPPSDFLLTGEARLRRLTTRLEASGITITKYAIGALTVKCINRATGEEIYFNTVVPKGAGSWATEEEALRAVAAGIADEFSRDFFLQHVNVAGRRVALVVDGLPGTVAEAVAREFASLPMVLSVRPRAGAWDLELGGSGSAAERVAAGVLAPLNRKLGQACFAPGASAGDEVRVAFDAKCSDASVLSRLETYPPAGLYGAPSGRTKAVISNPETLRKLQI
ncbi:MAG TPA: serine/threonine protein kinase, partial [Casimicrobiaceae bacterium]|nr:serine/threonine protein kinase [Casimicrobiaceae bacterium]